MKTIRIFISSPGDVQEERDRARNVVHQLRRRYAGRLDLRALLWEELPLQADMSFQQGIDMVLSENGVDIAIFILWSRLGSPTGPLAVGEEGRPYRSGTEREWDLMLRARERCQREGSTPRPSIIVYTRQDEVSFEERLRGKPDELKAEEIDQKRLVTQFIEEQFRDAETGVNIRAYHSFDQPTTFARQLRIHLTNLLDPLAGDDRGEPVWSIADQGPPFRGLDVFEYHHAPIFFGREDEIVSIRTRLREQACRGCAFVLISGPSGSGKSSLARAGVLPDVCHYEIDADIQQWRWLALKPSTLGDDLLGGLVNLMTADDALPELREWDSDIVAPKDSASVREWLTRFGLRVEDALKAAGGRRGATRLIVLVDQMEELFSETAITDQSRAQLFDALEVLARSGSVWVLATVRSDFYHHCQTLPALVQMKEGSGWFDLLPPTADALSRVITGPAMLAGLRFERDGEQTLSDVILREAVEHKELLPLVEHLLLELCQHRSEDGTLTFAEFGRLGGVEGALRQRCEETFDRVSPAAQASLSAVLSELVTWSGDGQETFVRRTVPLDHFAGHPVQRELIDAMVAARLFTTSSGPDGGSVVSVAHEALLRVWPRVTEWIILNREHLRLRARVEHSRQRWEQQGQDDSLLLHVGLPLNEARQLLGEAPHLLSSGTKDYIEASVRFDEKRARRRRLTAAVSIVLLAIGGWFAWETRGRLQAEGVVQAIYTATPSELEALIQNDLPSLRRWADKPLRSLANDPSAPADQRLRASLASLPTDPSQIDYLEQRLLDCSFDEFPVIRDALKNAAIGDECRALIRDLWQCLTNTQEDHQRRFRAGMALAALDFRSDAWTDEDARLLTEWLLNSNPDYQLRLREHVAPIAARLRPHLETAFQNEEERESVRTAAANALAQYLAGDSVGLCRLLAVAAPEQYDVLYPILEDNPTPDAIEVLAKIAATLPPDDMGSVERVPYGQQRANAAVTLLRLGERERVLPVFEITDDPESLTQFIFRCRPRGVAVDALLDCLRLASEAPKDRYPRHTRYALLLALGEDLLTDLPEGQREPLLRQLEDWYAHDPSSGVHGATGWLLRQWGKDDIVRKVDQAPVPPSSDREWFTLAITVTPKPPPKPQEQPATDNDGTQSEPSDTAEAAQPKAGEAAKMGTSREPAASRAQPLPPKTVYYTFHVFPAGEYTIGSVKEEPDRVQSREERHRVKLTRPFALLDREVTFEELIAFSPQYVGFMQQFNARLADAGYGADWYHSVAFCRWLGQQSGLFEGDQSYPAPEALDKVTYPRETNPSANWAPRDWPVDLGRRGFRLPTEAEWEVATRGGARTAYGYGSDVSLLGRFGWFQKNSDKHVHPPRQLRPSVRGLFDLHGNVWEWTHDWYDDSGSETVTDPVGPKQGSVRVHRGGSWRDDAANCRTSRRVTYRPTMRANGGGFRLVLSPTGVTPEAAQDN